MFALVNKSDNSIIKDYSGRKGIRIDENQYQLYLLYGQRQRETQLTSILLKWITLKKSTEWYINTDITYVDGSKVTGSYGDATARAHVSDTLWTSQDKTDGKILEGKDVGDVVIEGLKTVLINQVKSQAEGELNKTDWYIIRKSGYR